MTAGNFGTAEPVESDSSEYRHLYHNMLTAGRPAFRLEPVAGPLAKLAAFRAAADDMILRYVDDYRKAGFTWEQIGDELGITKQAASQLHKRATRLF